MLASPIVGLRDATPRTYKLIKDGDSYRDRVSQFVKYQGGKWWHDFDPKAPFTQSTIATFTCAAGHIWDAACEKCFDWCTVCHIIRHCAPGMRAEYARWDPRMTKFLIRCDQGHRFIVTLNPFKVGLVIPCSVCAIQKGILMAKHDHITILPDNIYQDTHSYLRAHCSRCDRDICFTAHGIAVAAYKIRKDAPPLDCSIGHPPEDDYTVGCIAAFEAVFGKPFNDYSQGMQYDGYNNSLKIAYITMSGYRIGRIHIAAAHAARNGIQFAIMTPILSVTMTITDICEQIVRTFTNTCMPDRTDIDELPLICSAECASLPRHSQRVTRKCTQKAKAAIAYVQKYVPVPVPAPVILSPAQSFQLDFVQSFQPNCALPDTTDVGGYPMILFEHIMRGAPKTTPRAAPAPTM